MIDEREENIEKQILAAENRISKAISKLFDLDDILRQICEKIKNEFNFDFVGISLVFLAQNTIDAVYGIGIANDWSNRVRHYIEEDPDIRDIQVDIIKTLRTEIISGWDKRFDRGIYETFKHDEIIRIYTPLLIVRDKNGSVVSNWCDKFDWEINFTNLYDKNENRNLAFNINFPDNFASVKAIGTIEAGFQNRGKSINHNTAIELAKLASKLSLEIRETRLRYILEIIAETTKSIMQADSVTLHFLLDSNLSYYIYQVRSGNINNSDPEIFSPRLHNEGLGWRAIQTKCVQYIDLSNHGSINSKAYEKGTRAYAAFPLLINRNKKQTIIQATEAASIISEEKPISKYLETTLGVLYIHYKNNREFTIDEIRIGQVLAEKAVEAIWQAMTYQQVRDKIRYLKGHQSVIQSINQIPENCDVLGNIAWNVLNILAADIVTIYPYNQAKNEFITPPSSAGKLKSEKEMETNIHKGEISHLILLETTDQVTGNESIFIEDTTKNELFNNSPFTRREKISSLACVLLKNDDDVVGIMFVNYRRKHIFSEEDKQNINTLASSAATAIKNQRWTQTLNIIDKEIITTLEPDKLADLIIQRAVEIANADLGAILIQQDLIDLSILDLIEKSVYAAGNHTIPEERNCIANNNIIFKFVKENLDSKLNNDNLNNSGYFRGTNSQICVPLLGKDNGGNTLLGVINVESFRKKFTMKDIQNLNILSDLAVIAIQNAESKEILGNAQMMSNIGDLASQLLHRMNSRIGALKVNVADLNEYIIENDLQLALQMCDRTQNILGRMEQDWKSIKGWESGNPTVHNIKDIIDEALRSIETRSIISLQNYLSNSSIELKVLAQKYQLIGIFKNLIQNSIDAMSDGGILSISGNKIERESYNLIEIAIIDNGSGIREEDLSKIRQRGYTTKNWQGKFNWGFGLWWTDIELKTLRGKLNIASSLDRGTTAIVTFRTSKNMDT